MAGVPYGENIFTPGITGVDVILPGPTGGLVVSGTNVKRSRVSEPSNERLIAYQFFKTGAGFGTFRWQVNNLSDKAYEFAINGPTAGMGATGPDRISKEMNNTIGWTYVDVVPRISSGTPTGGIGVATGAGSSVFPGMWSNTVKLEVEGFKRNRWEYQHLGGPTSAIQGWVVSS